MLYSTGTDSLLKSASSLYGKVVSKCWLPGTISNTQPAPPATVLLPLNPQHLLMGTDAAKVHLLDLRTSVSSNNLPSAVVSTWTPDAPVDYISSLTALPPGKESTSGYSYHFLGTGSGYMFHMDSRRPGKVLRMSEDQDDEILCSAVVPGWGSSVKKAKEESQEVKILTGLASGIVSVWDRAYHEGHNERINTVRVVFALPVKGNKGKAAAAAAAGAGESVDCITLLPESFEPVRNNLDKTQIKRQAGFWGRHVAVGTGDGRVKVVRTGGNPGVVGVYEHFPIGDKDREKAERRKKLIDAGIQVHDDQEEGWEEPKEAVLSVGVTVDGRLVSGGGGVVTMFFDTPEEDEEEEVAGAESGNAMEVDGEDGVSSTQKRARSDSDGGDNSDSDGSGGGWGSDDSSDDEEKARKRAEKKKRRKKGKKGAVSRPQMKNISGNFAGLD